MCIRDSNSVFIDGGGVGDDDLVVGFQGVAEILGEHNMESAIVVQLGGLDLIVGSSHSSAVQGNTCLLYTSRCV